MNNLISNLTEMGFTDKQAHGALTLTNRQLDQAIVLLLERPDRVDALIAKNMMEEQQRRMANDRRSPSTFLEGGVSKSQARNNFKTVSGWFDKAKAQFDEILDDSKQAVSANTDHMVESFTITVGAQVRRIHNLRLLVGRLDHMFYPNTSIAEISALHAQTSETLYSRKLNGLVVLADINDIPQYKLGQGNAKLLYFAVQKQAELHFGDYESQINDVEQAWSQNTLAPQEGDVFITKHSNLPGVHVIFHLCTDFSTLKSELTQRSPLIQGLRNILMAVHQYEIKNLIMPVLLLPDTAPPSTSTTMPRSSSRNALLSTLQRSSSSNNSMAEISSNGFTDQYISKRCEVILKSVKAMLLELSRSYGKHGETRHGASSTDDQTVSNTFQFVLPPWLAKESTFESLRNLLRAVYRTV